MKPGRRDGRDESEDLPLHEDFTPAGHGMESRMSVALFARFPHSVDFSGPGVAMSPRSVCFAAIFRTGGGVPVLHQLRPARAAIRPCGDTGV